jgi:hypothetical protein
MFTTRNSDFITKSRALADDALALADRSRSLRAEWDARTLGVSLDDGTRADDDANPDDDDKTKNGDFAGANADLNKAEMGNLFFAFENITTTIQDNAAILYKAKK